jgi:hypothetical protein
MYTALRVIKLLEVYPPVLVYRHIICLYCNTVHGYGTTHIPKVQQTLCLDFKLNYADGMWAWCLQETSVGARARAHKPHTHKHMYVYIYIYIYICTNEYILTSI